MKTIKIVIAIKVQHDREIKVTKGILPVTLSSFGTDIEPWHPNELTKRFTIMRKKLI